MRDMLRGGCVVMPRYLPRPTTCSTREYTYSLCVNLDVFVSSLPNTWPPSPRHPPKKTTVSPSSVGYSRRLRKKKKWSKPATKRSWELKSPRLDDSCQGVASCLALRPRSIQHATNPKQGSTFACLSNCLSTAERWWQMDTFTSRITFHSLCIRRRRGGTHVYLV